MRVAEAIKVFRKLGMQTAEGRDTNAKFIHDGRVITYSRVSHGRGEIGGNVPHFIRQQLKVSEDQLRRLLECTIGRKEYEEILRFKGLTQ
jgi:hypothetical protein